MSSEEVFTINSAAKLTGYSLPTIRKRLPELQAAGASLIDGRWAIPLSALHKCGLMLKVEGVSKPGSKSLQSETETELKALRAENERLRGERDVAQALAAERLESLTRERQQVDRLFLQLEAGTSTRRRKWLFNRGGNNE